MDILPSRSSLPPALHSPSYCLVSDTLIPQSSPLTPPHPHLGLVIFSYSLSNQSSSSLISFISEINRHLFNCNCIVVHRLLLCFIYCLVGSFSVISFICRLCGTWSVLFFFFSLILCVYPSYGRTESPLHYYY
jgi:hypothetical protein